MSTMRPHCLSLVALALAGCIAEVTFDPVGTAASVEGSWTIAGAPASADTCRAMGIDYVRVRFYREERTADHPHLVFPCEQGSFDTRPDRVVADGTWTMALVAIDAEGNQIAVGPQETVTSGAVDEHIALAPVDFTGGASFDPSGTDATVTASWTIGGSSASAASCEAVSANTVDLVLYASDDVARSVPATVHAGAPCADGAYDSGAPVLAAGEYLVSGVLRGPTSDVVSSVDQAAPVTVTAGAPLAIDLDFRLESSLIDLRFAWDSPSTGAPATCDGAGVGRMTWRLDYVDATGAVTSGIADSGGAIACAEHVAIARASLTAGTYRVYFDGSTAAGAPTEWMVQGACEAIIDGPGGLGVASCEAAYAGP